MATLSVTMALGTVGMTAEAAAQTDKAQTNVQTQQAAADTKVQGESNLKLPTEWDKVFPESRDVNHRKVTFHNRYGIELAADLYEPKKITGKLAAVAVSGPFGAVKEQSSGLYAQELAKRGFLTIAFDPSFTGESGGVNGVRNVASPDINTEDFSAAVDFLANEKDVDPDRIGILGICGWGGLALNAAALDTRIKAVVASTMYDMSRVSANGYFDAADNEKSRHEMRRKLNAQRTKEYAQGFYEQGGGVVEPLPADAPEFVKDYYDYYKTPRGYHERSGNSNDGWTVTGTMSFLNQPILAYSREIRAAVLLIHGEKAHSRYFSEDAYRDMSSYTDYRDNKELLIVPGASHTDLYDGGGRNAIPFDRLERFFGEHLKK